MKRYRHTYQRVDSREGRASCCRAESVFLVAFLILTMAAPLRLLDARDPNPSGSGKPEISSDQPMVVAQQ